MNTDEYPQHQNFYQELSAFSDFSQFTDLSNYQSLPTNWFVIITDVKGSTAAIEKGLYKEVNSLGAACIVALLNAVSPLKVPYVFGGDGATVCIPSECKADTESALVAAKEMAKNRFGLNLRIGMVPMSNIESTQHQVLVGKYQPSEHFEQAMFQGDGLAYAEQLIKADTENNPYIISESGVEANGSFEGFECRWNEVPSPHDETVAILVQALADDIAAKEQTYDEVSQKIISIYGDEKEHHPLRLNNLALTHSVKKLSNEMKIRVTNFNFWNRVKYLFQLEWLACIGRYVMQKKIKTENTNWGNYKQTLVANTDYRKFDEVLRMIISGTKEQRKQLTTYLEQLYKDGQIVFGINASANALITCLVFNYENEHVHFLDGSDGGYALAAKEMKQQLKDKNI